MTSDPVSTEPGVAPAVPHYAPLLALDQEAVRCPYPYFERLRNESPVEWIEELGCFAVSRYTDVLEVLRNPEVFSSRMPTGAKATNQLLGYLMELLQESGELRAVLGETGPIGLAPVLLNADPPAHNRQRALVSRAFSPRRVQQLEPQIREIADRLIDGFAARGSCEFVHEFAVGLPLTVIARALGVPEVDMPVFKRWSDDFVVAIGNHRLTKERLADLLRTQAEFFSYFSATIEERRRQPRDDLLTDVVQARMDGTEPLTTHEMLGMLSQFLVAGNETTTKLLASAMLLLLREPELMARLRADYSLIPGFIEEALRLEAPVQGLFRMANVDTDVGGVPIPAGSSIWVLYASANRDAAEFADPDRLDPCRPNAKLHLAFGQGIHYCIGASLSRAEGRIAFEALLDRFEDIALAPGNSFEFEPSYALHGLKALHLQLRARA